MRRFVSALAVLGVVVALWPRGGSARRAARGGAPQAASPVAATTRDPEQGAAAPVRHGEAAAHGRVVQASSGAPVPDARVHIEDIEGDREWDRVTDEAGRFLLPDAPPRPVWCAAEAKGFVRTLRYVRPTDFDGSLVLTVGDGGVVEGRVIGSDGTPAGRAEIRFEGDDLAPWWNEQDGSGIRAQGRVTADATGRFRMEGLPIPSGFAITARDAAGHVGRACVRCTDAASVWCELRIEASTAIRARPVVPAGEPPGRITMALFRAGGDSIGFQRSDPNDEDWFRWEVDPGAYEAVAWGGGWTTSRVPVAAIARRVVEIEIPMRRDPARTVTGRVVHERGPARGASVEVDGKLAVQTGADGRFVVPDLEGPAAFRVRDSLVRYSDVTGTVAPGEHLTVRLRARSRFVGRVQPVPDGPIALHLEFIHPQWSGPAVGMHHLVPDAEGRFTFPWSLGAKLRFVPPRGDAIALDQPALHDTEVRDLGVLRFGLGRRLGGRVVDEHGRPVADARVAVRIEGLPGARAVYPGSDGAFVFPGLPRGDSEFTAAARGRVPVVRRLDPAAEALGDVVLHPAAWIEISVAPPGRHDVEIADEDGSGLYLTTDRLGRRRAFVAPGRVRVTCGDAASAWLDVAASATTRVALALDDG